MENTQKLIFKKPVTEIIKQRLSVRSYESRTLADEVKKDLRDYISDISSPFAANVRFKLIDTEAAADNGIKLGTYGMIRGASSFVVSAVENTDMGLETLGYRLEKFVLYATSLGLGTCWLGGTFKKGEFAKAMELKNDELLPIVTPIGYPGNSKNFFDSLVRMAAGSKNRKPWEEIFFDGSFDKKLTSSVAGIYSTALEMLRLAPSASNKQPWRIVKNDNTFHFYISRNRNYSKGLDFDIQKIDMGIGMCHFDLTLKEAGIDGSFVNLSPHINFPEKSLEYIISWAR